MLTHFTLCFVLVSSPFLFVVRSRFVFTMFELTAEDYYFFFYHEQLTVLHLLPIHKDYRYFYVYCVLLAVVVLSQSVFFERERVRRAEPVIMKRLGKDVTSLF